MIYNDNEEQEYRVKFYLEIRSNISPVKEYIDCLNAKERAKILKYIEFLRENKGVLNEPYSKHISGKIRELRIDFSINRHRIFYFTFINKTIILLHVFLKKTPKTPAEEIKRAEYRLQDVLLNKKIYE